MDNTTIAYLKKLISQQLGSSFVDMSFKNSDSKSGNVTYVVRYKKADGTITGYDVTFKDGKDAPVFVGASKENDSLNFKLSDGNVISLMDFYKDMRGEQGVQGNTGAQGVQGIQGEKGEKGDKGDIGRTPKYEFMDTKIRFQKDDLTWGDFVDIKGDKGNSAYSVYVNTTTDNPILTEKEWLLSLQGQGFNLKGDYNSTKTYFYMDVVTLNNVVYGMIKNKVECPNGIIGLKPDINSDFWVKLLSTQAIDVKQMIDDLMVKTDTGANAKTWSVVKISNELETIDNKKANKDNVIAKDNKIPFEAIEDYQPVVKKQMDTAIASVKPDLDKIAETDTHKIMTKDEREKLASLQPSLFKGQFTTPVTLKASYPDGDSNLKDGSYSLVLDNTGDTKGKATVFLYTNGSWKDTGATNVGMTLDEFKAIYDTQNVAKDCFDVSNLRENTDRKFVTTDEKNKIKDIGKLDSKVIDNTNIADGYGLFYDANTDSFKYKDGRTGGSQSIDNVGYFIGSQMLRTQMKTNPKYNTKDYLFFDTTLRTEMFFQSASGQYFQYKGQDFNGILPMGASDRDKFQGQVREYEFVKANDYWKITNDTSDDLTAYYRPLTTAQRLAWKTSKASNRPFICYDTDMGITLVYTGLGTEFYEQPANGLMATPVFPTIDTLELLQNDNYYYDKDNLILWHWDSNAQAWDIITEKVRKYYGRLATNPAIVPFGDIDDFIKIKTINADPSKIYLTIGTIKAFNTFRCRLYNNTMDMLAFDESYTLQMNEESDLNYKKTLVLGHQYELSIVNLIQNVVFNIIFNVSKNAVYIKDVKAIPASSAIDYEFPKISTPQRKIAKSIPIPDSFKCYYDTTLKKALICRKQTVDTIAWSDLDTKFEEIMFPENPLESQKYTSRGGNVYQWQSTSAYWKLVLGDGVNGQSDKIVVTRSQIQNVGTNSNVDWQPDLIIESNGECELDKTKGAILLKANKQYDLKAMLSISTVSYTYSHTAYGFYSLTKGYWIPSQIWGSGTTVAQGYANQSVTNPLAFTTYTPTTDEWVTVRIYSNQCKDGCIISGNVNPINGTSYFSAQQVGSTSLNYTKLEGQYSSYFMGGALTQVLSQSNRDVKWNTVKNYGENVSISADGVFITLKKGGTYEVEASLAGVYNATNCNISFGFYDMGGQLLPGQIQGNCMSDKFNDLTEAGDRKASIVVNPMQDLTFRVSHIAQGTFTLTLGASCKLIVRQLGTTSVLVDSRVDVMAKQNHKSVVNNDLLNGDLWLDKNDGNFKARANGETFILTNKEKAKTFCNLSRGAGYNLVGNWNYILFDNKPIDTQGIGNLNTTSNSIVIRDSGFYRVSAQGEHNSSPYILIQIMLNAVSVLCGDTKYITGTQMTCNCSRIVYLPAGSSLGLKLYASSPTTTTNGYGGTFLEVEKLD